MSLEDSPGRWGGGGGEKLGIKLKLSFSWGLGLAELGNNIPSFKIFLGGWMGGWVGEKG